MNHGATVRPLNAFNGRGSSTSASGGPVNSNVDGMAKGDGVEDECSEVSRRPRVARRPQMPTKAEVDAT